MSAKEPSSTWSPDSAGPPAALCLPLAAVEVLHRQAVGAGTIAVRHVRHVADGADGQAGGGG